MISKYAAFDHGIMVFNVYVQDPYYECAYYKK